MESFIIPPSDAIPSDWQRSDRSYTIATEALPAGSPATLFTMTGYWFYEWSVIMPCPATDNQWVFLLNRNYVATEGQNYGEVITMRTSDYPDSGWSDETIILANLSGTGTGVDYPDNICDMIGCRPIWDGSNWHIYVQAVTGNYASSPPCSTAVNNIYEASGPSLAAGSLQWVRESGTNHAQAIISGSGTGPGIGQELQAFNPTLYGLPDWPFMLTYQNWGCTDTEGDCGHATFNYLSEDDSTYDYWYGPGEIAYLPVDGYSSALYFPDGILLGSLDSGRHGYPGLGFLDQGLTDDNGYNYALGLGFFDNPSNVPYMTPLTVPYGASASPNHAWPFAGSFESYASDGYGPRMRSPKLARNEYGYVVPQSYHGFPRTWVTYLYYCPDVRWNWGGPQTQPQSLCVSKITITETLSNRVQS